LIGPNTHAHAHARRGVLESLPKNSVGVEIGVWRGDFSSLALEIVEPSLLHMVDPWLFAGDDLHRGAMYAGSVANSQPDMDGVYAEVLARFAAEREAGVVCVHRCRSDEAASRLADGSLDWVYVDGDHLYEAVGLDLALYWPKLRVGGELWADDYLNVDRWWGDGIKRAVDKFVTEQDLCMNIRFRQAHITKMA